MTKLEEKLIMLGYERNSQCLKINKNFDKFCPFYVKLLKNKKYGIYISISSDYKVLEQYCKICCSGIFENDKDKEDFLEVFDIFKQDLKELKEYERY